MTSIRSMTAFSRQEGLFQQATLAWEIRSVNHRYLDLNFRLPETLRSLEPVVRERLRKKLSRGKVDCSLQLLVGEVPEQQLQLNQDRLQQYLQAVVQINAQLESPAPINALDLLFKPGVIVNAELDPDALKQAALALFDETLQQHIAHRLREGEQLASLITERLSAIEAHVNTLRPLIPQLVQQQRDKLRKRLAECEIEPDSERFEQEIVLLSQKIDVDEELDRLQMHVQEVQRVLAERGSVGRRLDFLMQELNREANTLSSKSISTETTRIGVDLKVLIEQMREQIQNIE